MKRTARFLTNTAFLASLSIIMRGVSLSFNAYISAKIGAESMGLFTLVMSLYGFVVTLACSGVNLASVRLTVESCARLSAKGADRGSYKIAVRTAAVKCAVYCLAFSITTGAVLFFLSPIIGKHLLGDVRSILSLKALAVSLPAIALSSSFAGVFTGLGKVYKNAVCSVSEQALKIIITSSALAIHIVSFTDKVEYACLAVVGGSALAEAFSLVLSIIMYLFDSKLPQGTTSHKNRISTDMKLSDVGKIAFPVAVGAYARQGLSALEHMSIPVGLRKSGLSNEEALSRYGILGGMVFPLLLFPSAVITSAGGLLVPEFAAMKELNEKTKIKEGIRNVFFLTVSFSFGVAAVMLIFSNELGISIYSRQEAGKYIYYCAALVPVMYFDMAVDSVLKGLGEQLHSMKINLIDSGSSLILVLILTPLFGLNGYIVSVYFCEILNCILSFLHLKKTVEIPKILTKTVVKQLICVILTYLVCMPLIKMEIFVSIFWKISLYVAIYSLLTYIFSNKKYTNVKK